MIKTAICAIILAILTGTSASAGPYADSLAKCIVESTSEREKNKMINWFFIVISEHPELQPLADISQNQKLAAHQNMAEITTEILTKSCLQETKNGIKYEGDSVVEFAFGFLGRNAMQGIMSHEKVTHSIQVFMQFVDEDEFQKIFTP